jgi:hypothetical protein
MTRVIVDAVTRARLVNARDPLELCDDSGQVLGRFIPSVQLSQCADAGPQISEEELDRRERAGGGRPLSDILAALERTR